MKFIGVDLGWYGKPSGLACLEETETGLRLAVAGRQAGVPGILDWIDEQAGGAEALIAVDAPTVITNAEGARLADRSISSAFGRYEAGCHSANLGMPFAALTTGFGRSLTGRGFAHAAEIEPRKPGRYQIEVYPHPAIVSFFDLTRIIKYKKGTVTERASELARLRVLMLTRMPIMNPALELGGLPDVPHCGGDLLKSVEDRLDAIITAYIGAYWWRWGAERNRVFGNESEGYIVVPNRLQSVTAAVQEAGDAIAPTECAKTTRGVGRAEAPKERRQSTASWIVPLSATPDEGAIDWIRRVVVGRRVFGFHENNVARRRIEPGDEIAFYATAVGVAAYAKVATAPEHKPQEIQGGDFPWVVSLMDVKYLDHPTRIDAELRSRLDAFRNKDLNSIWAWFVQTAHQITAHDYSALTKLGLDNG